MQPTYMTPIQNTYHPEAYAGDYGACACPGGALGAPENYSYSLKNFIFTPRYLVGFFIGFMLAKAIY